MRYLIGAFVTFLTAVRTCPAREGVISESMTITPSSPTMNPEFVAQFSWINAYTFSATSMVPVLYKLVLKLPPWVPCSYGLTMISDVMKRDRLWKLIEHAFVWKIYRLVEGVQLLSGALTP